MGKRIAGIDAYIRKTQPFARPILEHLRDVVHAACPEVEEKLKWSHPHFDYKGMMCGTAAFKSHATFGFWKHSVMVKEASEAAGFRRDAMGSFGRLTSVDDLPPRRELVKLIRLAMKLNDDGVKNPVRSNPKPKRAIRPPAAFSAALKKNKKALAIFESFPPSQKREYLEWITEAKTDATRDQRISTAVEWMAEGKRRNWKYAKK
jgi:uncharacterized protein YdeI (YjbR/CyaY-like superfamily)